MDFSEGLHEHLDALQAKDLARFAATLGDDVTVIDGRGGRTHGTASVLQSHAEWFAAAEPWTFEYGVIFTRVSGAHLRNVPAYARYGSRALRPIARLRTGRGGLVEIRLRSKHAASKRDWLSGR
jgi:hypothetical protein